MPVAFEVLHSMNPMVGLNDGFGNHRQSGTAAILLAELSGSVLARFRRGIRALTKIPT